MIKFLNRKIEIVWDEDLSDAYVERCPDLNYKLFLSKKTALITHVIIHELWHIFFDALAFYDNNTTSFSDLSKDIYAYSFDELYKETNQEISKHLNIENIRD